MWGNYKLGRLRTELLEEGSSSLLVLSGSKADGTEPLADGRKAEF